MMLMKTSDSLSTVDYSASRKELISIGANKSSLLARNGLIVDLIRTFSTTKKRLSLERKLAFPTRLTVVLSQDSRATRKKICRI
jgi:hypothetical protein